MVVNNKIAEKEAQKQFEEISVEFAKAFASSGKTPGEESLRKLSEHLLNAFVPEPVQANEGVRPYHEERLGGDPLHTNQVYVNFSDPGPHHFGDREVVGHLMFTKDSVEIYSETGAWGYVNRGPDDAEKDFIVSSTQRLDFDARCIGGFLESSMLYLDDPEIIAKRQEALDYRAACEELREYSKSGDLSRYISVMEKFFINKRKDFAEVVVSFVASQMPDNKNVVVGAVVEQKQSDGEGSWTVTPIVKIPKQVSDDGTVGTKYSTADPLSGKGDVLPYDGTKTVWASEHDFSQELFDVFDRFGSEAFVPDVLKLTKEDAWLDTETTPEHPGAVAIEAEWLLNRALEYNDDLIFRNYYGLDLSEGNFSEADVVCAREEARWDAMNAGLFHVELEIDGGDGVKAYAVGEGNDYCEISAEEIPLTPTESRALFDRFESDLVTAKDAALSEGLESEPEV